MIVHKLAKELNITNDIALSELKELGLTELKATSKIKDAIAIDSLRTKFKINEIAQENTLAPTIAATSEITKAVDLEQEEAIEFEKPTKKQLSKPWEPVSLLSVPKKFQNPNFRYRWCNKDKPGNIRKKESEGWEVDYEVTRLMKKHMKSMNQTTADGKSIDSTLQVRELIWMRMPKEMAEARNKYWQDKANNPVKNEEKSFKGKMAAMGAETYGSIISQ
jgi:hypothetical protein